MAKRLKPNLACGGFARCESGLNAEGRVFSQSARAQNITSGRTDLGSRNRTEGSDRNRVQWTRTKRAAPVIWAMNAASIKKEPDLCVKLVTQECPATLFATRRRDGGVFRFHRRAFTGHKISLPLELRDQRVQRAAPINAPT